MKKGKLVKNGERAVAVVFAFVFACVYVLGEPDAVMAASYMQTALPNIPEVAQPLEVDSDSVTYAQNRSPLDAPDEGLPQEDQGDLSLVTTGNIKGQSADGQTPVTFKLSAASIRLNKSKVTLYLSGKKTVQLTASVSGTNKKVTWKSSNSKVASVSTGGKVTAKKQGTAVITAKVNGKKATCTVTVKSADELRALTSFVKVLKEKDIDGRAVYQTFRVLNLVGDGTSELLTYTASEGGVVHLWKYDPKKKEAVFLAYGTDSISIDKTRKRIVMHSIYGGDYHYYEVDDFNGKFLVSYENQGNMYLKNTSQRITASAYQKAIKGYLKNTVKYTKADVWYTNSQANRNKYLGR